MTDAALATEPDPRYELNVTSVSWERVWLTIHLEAAPLQGSEPLGETLDTELFTARRQFPAPAARVADGKYEILINVTTFADREAIPNGRWRIRLASDPGTIATVDAAILPSFDDTSRVFLFNSSRQVYTVSFGIADSDERLDFQVRAFHMVEPPARRRLRQLPRRVRKALIGPAAKRRYARLIYWFFRTFIGPRKGQLLFASEQRTAIEGNLKRVHERLVERGLADNYTMKYSFRIPKDSAWRSTIRVLYLLATSETVLLDDYFAMLNNIPIDNRTRIIQLWHAGSGFKAVGFSRFGNSGSPMLQNAHRSYTYAITGSTHLVHVYAEAFGIEPEAIIPTGLPRVDWFLDEERTQAYQDEFYAQYPHLKGKRIILFAPTFRGSSIKTAYYDYDLIDFKGLYETCGPDTVVLFRMHHFVDEPISIPAEYADRFFDFTKYPKGLELLHVTDLLITDYSSIIYEYSLLDRPMLFFAPDKVNYAATRGFHRDYDETAPGRVATTFAEVLDAIATGEFEVEKVAQFRAENFDRVDTGAADRVIDQLLLADAPPRLTRQQLRALAASREQWEDEAGHEEDHVV